MWFSRFIISGELSNSMEVSFCQSALERALSFAQPEVFNSDQGAQFTSPKFTNLLTAREVKISMDGRGRYLDNIWVNVVLEAKKCTLKEYSTPVEA